MKEELIIEEELTPMEKTLRNLNAKQVDKYNWIIELQNGEEIFVEKRCDFISDWDINGFLFTANGYAINYLSKLIAEKLTGMRVINRAKGYIPKICGYNGANCRAPKECNRPICSRCPIADKFFAERDGVELIYMFG